MKKQAFMKKVGLSLGVFLMAGTVVSTTDVKPVQVEAATVTKYQATANVNLRSKATVSSKSLGVILKGKEVTYLGKSGSWYKVKYGTKTGYVSSTYLKKSSTVTSPKTPVGSVTVYTTSDALNLRAGASTKYKTLLTIPKGKAVTMVAYGTSWSKVTYSGKTGYVSSKYLKKSTVNTGLPVEEKFAAKKFQTTTTVSLYTSASAGKTKVLSIPKGKVVTSSSKMSGLYKVTYGGKTGWVLASQLKEYKPAPAKPPVVEKKDFLSKSDSIKLLTSESFDGDSRKVFETKNEYGMTFVHSFMVGASESAREEFQFVVGEYDSKKLSSMSFMMTRYNKYEFAQKNGMKALEVGLSGFFGKGTNETEELTKLVKENMTYREDKVINLSISGKKGYLVVTKGSLDVIFDNDGSLPIINL